MTEKRLKECLKRWDERPRIGPVKSEYKCPLCGEYLYKIEQTKEEDASGNIGLFCSSCPPKQKGLNYFQVSLKDDNPHPVYVKQL
jgi:hypothetical protein